MCGELRKHGPRATEDVGLELVDEPEAKPGGGIEETSAEHDLGEMGSRDTRADDGEDPRREADAERHLVETDLGARAFDHHAMIAAEGEHAAASDGVTVDRGDRRRRMQIERGHHPLEEHEEALHRGRVERADLFQVEPGGERVGGAGEKKRSLARGLDARQERRHRSAAETILARCVEDDFDGGHRGPCREWLQLTSAACRECRMRSGMSRLALASVFGVMLALGCKGKSDKDGDKEIDVDAVKKKMADELVPKVKAAVPKDLGKPLDFKVSVEADGKIVAVVPADWKRGVLNDWNPPGGDFGNKVWISTNCDGMCQKKDWAKVVEKVDLAPLRTADFTVVKEEKLDDGKLLVAKKKDDEKDVRAVVVRWKDDARQYYACRVDLNGDYAAAIDAFVMACRGFEIVR